MTKPEVLNECVTLYEGNCLDVLPTLDRATIDAVISDPPYGIHHKSNRASSWQGRVIDGDEDTALRDEVIDAARGWGVPWLMFGSPKRTPPATARGTLIWDKGPAFGMGDLSFPWKPSWEEIYVGGKGWEGSRDEGVIRGHIQVSWESQGRFHPNQKPVSLIRYFLSKLPAGDAAILDPFAGSGTTAIAAMLSGRRCVLVEKDPRYCDVIRRRVERASGDGAGSLFRAADVPEPSLFSGGLS